MKKSRSIIGLPVVAIKEGKEVGRVMELLLNPSSIRMEFLLVGQGSRYIDLKLLALSRVCGIGEYAVTMESEQMLKSVEEVPEARALLEACIDVLDKVVLTRGGNLAGMVDDIYVNEHTGEVLQLEYKNSNDHLHPVVIQGEDIISLGQDVMFIREASAHQVRGQDGSGPLHVSPRNARKTGTLLFQQKQRQFLVGKEVQRDIRDGTNQVIIPRGTIVTGDTLEVAEQYDRFGELTQWAR